ncbi:MAG: DUF3196 family protein [Erysipelotrichaceae bacterium]|nr:DUF3196 family protein [Erysipelotrichaceae bacterium]
MNYYDDILNKINELIKNNDINKALSIVEEELRAPYLPKDFNEKLLSIYDNFHKNNPFIMNDEMIEDFLYSTNEKQLIAVDQLNKKNLREYIDLCNEYLTSKGFINAKVLLVDSLIRQEIGEEIKMDKDGLLFEFIPKYQLPIEESDGYLSGKKHLNDYYLKEPSKAKIALDLLYKEMIMNLPINMNEEEGIEIAIKIIDYINCAFNK